MIAFLALLGLTIGTLLATVVSEWLLYPASRQDDVLELQEWSTGGRHYIGSEAQ